MGLLAGIDGGASRTVCWIADGSGQVLGKGESGSANYHKCGLYIAKTSIRDALAGALMDARRQIRDVEVLCAGVAGVARPRDKELFRQVFSELAAEAHLILEDDARIALAGATDNGPGVIVISGTGSIAMGIDRKGKRARAGGWGHVLGDEGSGYDIARQGLAAALKHSDGRGPKTALTKRIIRELYLDNLQDLIPILYSERVTPDRLAALFPLVVEAADEGDKVARKLLEDAAGELIEAVDAVVRKLDFERSRDFVLCASGGAWEASATLREHFQSLLKERLPRATLQEPLHPPQYGAILLAKAAV